MKIIDGDTSVEGKLYVLADDGVYVREKVSSTDYQHMHPDLRPEYEWKRIDAPEGITKIIVGVQSELFCIAKGQLHRRVRDRGYLAGEKQIWEVVEVK